MFMKVLRGVACGVCFPMMVGLMVAWNEAMPQMMNTIQVEASIGGGRDGCPCDGYTLGACEDLYPHDCINVYFVMCHVVSSSQRHCDVASGAAACTPTECKTTKNDQCIL